MHTAHQLASDLLHEAAQFRPGSPDSEYRIRAAWKLDQMARGIPSCEWTEYPQPQQERAA
ncbi:hypothetical protein [Paracoccus sp. PAR01]|uniref:hypothetical protein n=1 Tax=Paracoccus sp. PAR01 TaxID=2769282 RepID=UPI00177E1E02|nr:hypothetical protein [Paracoccus sp. PAR01]MBD9529011.1 hypothetical protein [Paracoccus sp. PAR01]